VDRGGEGWIVFSPLRTLCGGYGERPLGFDQTVNVEAIVVEELPSLLYRLELSSNKAQVLAHGAGSAVRNWVRLLPGDRVEVELGAHDLTRGRILKKIGNL
jgi:translation initiation factor IF-1